MYSLNVTKNAILRHVKSEPLNSDQENQFTCDDRFEYLEKEDIKICMDGMDWTIDNIFIDRFWISDKHGSVYIKVPTP